MKSQWVFIFYSEPQPKYQLRKKKTTDFTRAYTYFFSPKKAFTPSQAGCFSLIFKYFKCEGFDFQPFTRMVDNSVVHLLIFSSFPVWKVAISTLHTTPPAMWMVSPAVWMLLLRCEYLKNKAFTLKSTESQRKTSRMWRSECFFRTLNYVYTRARNHTLKGYRWSKVEQ